FCALHWWPHPPHTPNPTGFCVSRHSPLSRLDFCSSEAINVSFRHDTQTRTGHIDYRSCTGAVRLRLVRLSVEPVHALDPGAVAEDCSCQDSGSDAAIRQSRRSLRAEYSITRPDTQPPRHQPEQAMA